VGWWDLFCLFVFPPFLVSLPSLPFYPLARDRVGGREGVRKRGKVERQRDKRALPLCMRATDQASLLPFPTFLSRFSRECDEGGCVRREGREGGGEGVSVCWVNV